MRDSRRSRGGLIPRLAAATALALLAVGAPGAVAWAGGATTISPSAAPGAAPDVALLLSHRVWTVPRVDAAQLPLVAVRRPITGIRTVLPVIDVRQDSGGARWLRVGLPGRPNGRSGWIRAVATRPGSSRWSVQVELASRRLVVLLDGRTVRTFSVVVGAPATPTPSGVFFVEEAVALPARAPGAPFALALSARSDVLLHFDGGDGQVAIHGTRNLGGTPGTAASHGCIRVAEPALRWLVSRIGAGVSVTIR